MTGFNYGNGVSAAFGYSADRLQLTSLAYTKGTTTLLSLAYGYAQNSGNDGEITSITDSVDSGRSATYTYDALARLSTAVTTGSTNYPKWGLTWSYDRYGNRTGQSVAQTTPASCVAPMTCPTNSVTIDATTNRINGTGYSYDANGNMTGDGTNTLTYDAESRLLTSTGGGGSGTYTYDGNSLRVQKVSGSTTTVYTFSGSKVVAEYLNGAAPSAPTKEYIYSGAQLLATIAGSTTTYHHSDHLSPRLTTDTSGNQIGQQGHYPFGESWYSANSTTKFQFTSYERDTESGNDYAMMRYHINRLGRFSSPDPLGGHPSEPQSLNRFAYVQDDPINAVDPLGLILGPTIPWIPIPVILPVYTTITVDGGTPDSGSLTGIEPANVGPKGDYHGADRGGRDPDQKYKLSPKQLKALAECVKQLFGITLQSFTAAGPGQNGSFTGSTSNGTQVSVTTDGTTYNIAGLNTIRYGQPQPPSDKFDTTGLTLSGFYFTNYILGIPYWGHTFSPSTNFIANGLKFADALSNQVHELGHSLADILNLFKVSNGEGPQGGALQDCFNQKSAAP